MYITVINGFSAALRSGACSAAICAELGPFCDSLAEIELLKKAYKKPSLITVFEKTNNKAFIAMLKFGQF